MSKSVKRILIIVVVNISFFVLAAWLLPIRFETSDDITMANLVNGVWNGKSDPQMIFQNIIYGWFLQFLYSNINGIEWYSVCMVIAHIVSMSIITLYLFRKIDDKLLKYLVLVLFFVLWSYLIAKFQFTSTTALLSFSGILLLLDRKFLWGGLVLLLASFMRFNAAMMIGLFMSPIFIYTYKSEWKKSWLPLVLVLLLITGGKLIDKLHYSHSTELQSFMEHNGMRSRIQDNPNAWRAYGHLPNNISKNDYDLFLSFIYDSSVFTTDIMREIYETINATPVHRKLKNAIPYLIKPNKISLGIVVVSLLIFILMIQERKNRMLLIVTVALWFMTFVFISMNVYMKPYVYVASFYPIIYCFLFVLLKEKNVNKHLLHISYAMVTFCILYLSFVSLKYVNDYDMDIYSEQQKLIDKTEDKVLGLYYNECAISPFKLRQMESNKFAGFAFLTDLSEESNTFENIFINRIIIIIIKDSPIPNMIAQSLMEHNNINVSIKVIDESEHCYLVRLEKN